jgi:hypothetical protein
MCPAAVGRIDRNNERMRLIDHSIAAKEIDLWAEANLIDATAEARESDLEIDTLGFERSPLIRRPGTKLGRYTGFEYREFEDEVAVYEQVAVVGASLQRFVGRSSRHRSRCIVLPLTVTRNKHPTQ